MNCSRLYSVWVPWERRSCHSGGASGASAAIAPPGSDAFLGPAGPGTRVTRRMLRFSDLGIPLLMYPVIWYCIGAGCSAIALAAVLLLFHTEQTLRLSERPLRLCLGIGAWPSVSVFWVSSANFTGVGRSALGLHSCALGLFGRYSRQEYCWRRYAVFRVCCTIAECVMGCLLVGSLVRVGCLLFRIRPRGPAGV